MLIYRYYTIIIKSEKIDFATLKLNKKFAQSGTFTINALAVGSAAGQVSVTFATPFNNPPVVLLQITSSSAEVISAYLVGNPTSTGFTALARSTTVTQNSRPCFWYAVDSTEIPMVGI